MPDDFTGALFAYPWPFHRDGIDAALDRIERSGCREVVVTPAYHRADFFQPNDPDAPVLYGEDGRVFFDIHEAHYTATPIRPLRSRLVDGDGWFEAVVAGLRRRQLEVSLWLVYNFNDELSIRYPDQARHDPFGTPHRGALSCGADAVQGYFRALTRDLLARFEPGYVWVESLHRRGLAVPSKTRAPITPRCLFLLAMDWNPGMLARSVEDGLDADGLRRDVAAWLRPRLARMAEADDALPADAAWIASAFDGRLARYLATCQRVTTALWLEVAEIIHGAGVRIHHLPASAEGVLRTDLEPRVSRHVDRLLFNPPETAARRAVRAARQELAPAAQVYAGLHGLFESASDVADAVGAARDAGCDGASFYAYGLLRDAQLDWIGRALAQS